MRVTVLASGSAGNSILVEADRTRVLIDAGMAARELAKRLERSATPARLDDVQAVCVTHEHSDHAGGVATLASAGIKVYATEGTTRAARLTALPGGVETIVAGRAFTIGALEFHPVALPHDAAEPVGFIVTDGTMRAGVLTDCGHAAPEVAAAFASCELLVLETNHDPDMLRAGSYPPTLKRRIGGSRGHLSNDQAADILRLMKDTGKFAAKVLILAHLSATNNRPRLARQVIEKQLTRLGLRPRLLVAAQERPSPPVSSDGGLVKVLPSQDDRQMRLAFPDF